MKITITDELEQAELAYEEAKKGILYDLLTLDQALLDFTISKDQLKTRDYKEFTKILERTYKFIQKGEF